MDKHALLKSYCQPDENLLLAKVLDQADLSLKKHMVCFTEFLDPAMCVKTCQMLKYVKDLGFVSFGGYEESERNMIAVFPDYFSEEEIFFPIDMLGITYNTRFAAALSHRDFLGSVLGLGIERNKVGDIVVCGDKAYVFADKTVSDYIAVNLEKVGHTKVNAEICDISLISLPEKKIETKTVTVSSLRADTVFGAIFSKSRGDIQELIRAEKASINWVTVKSVSDAVNEGDILSLKGSGRGKLMEIGGTTKKGRLAIKVGRYI